MSNVKPQQNLNPFKGALAAPTVGKTYGERKARSQAPVATPTPAQRPVDQFSEKNKKAADLAAFDPNARYRSTKRLYDKDTPYQPAIIGQIQGGITRPGQPSNDALLKFLGHVIETPALHSAKNVRQAAFKGAPVQGKGAVKTQTGQKQTGPAGRS